MRWRAELVAIAIVCLAAASAGYAANVTGAGGALIRLVTGNVIAIGSDTQPAAAVALNADTVSVGDPTSNTVMFIRCQDADGQVQCELTNGVNPGSGWMRVNSTDELYLTGNDGVFMKGCNATPPTGSCNYDSGFGAGEVCSDAAGNVHACPSGGSW